MRLEACAPATFVWCFAYAVRVLPVSSWADLADMAFAVPYREDDGGVFMSAHRVGELVSRPRLAERWGNFTVALVDGSRCLGRGVAVPYDSRVHGRAEFPDGGWEQVVLWRSRMLWTPAQSTLCVRWRSPSTQMCRAGDSPLSSWTGSAPTLPPTGLINW